MSMTPSNSRQISCVIRRPRMPVLPWPKDLYSMSDMKPPAGRLTMFMNLIVSMHDSIRHSDTIVCAASNS
eukprot:18458-Heterococcus_DN1.PRE.2